MKKLRILAILLATCLLTGCAQVSQLKDYVEFYTESFVWKIPEDYEAAEESYYYNQLNEEEQEAYRKLLAPLQEYKEQMIMIPMETDMFCKAYMAIQYDHPELFWLSTFELLYDEEYVTSLAFKDMEGHEETSQQLHVIADSIIAGMPGGISTYEKVRYLYEYIIDNTDYDLEAEFDQDIRSVLLNQVSVCAGYAKTFKFLCNKAGIPCICVTGQDQNGEDHMWNMVWIEDQPYWVDTTWGDTAGEENDTFFRYYYLCLNDEELSQTHTVRTAATFGDCVVEDAFSYPECVSADYNYYRMEGCYFETYDRNEAGNYIVEKMKNKEYKNIGLKYPNMEECQKALDDLFGENGGAGCILDLINDEMVRQGWRSVECEYSWHEMTSYIELTLTP